MSILKNSIEVANIHIFSIDSGSKEEPNNEKRHQIISERNEIKSYKKMKNDKDEILREMCQKQNSE